MENRLHYWQIEEDKLLISILIKQLVKKDDFSKQQSILPSILGYFIVEMRGVNFTRNPEKYSITLLKFYSFKTR